MQKANSCHANPNGIACASIIVPQMPPTDTTWDYIAKIEYYIRVSECFQDEKFNFIWRNNFGIQLIL